MNWERYDRQIKLQGFGIEAQQKLSSATVLVIGAGGLGCPVLQYLAAAGVGTIGIADHDKVSISNLHRQVLYTSDDVGRFKAEASFQRLHLMNPEIAITVITEQITVKNGVGLISGYDLILDCTDNFPTRYMLDDACRLLKKPLIFGAVDRYEGQVAIFNTVDDQGTSASYRNLFPDPPGPGEIPDCNEAGVLGVLPGIIGTLQASEAIKLLTGIGNPLINKLMTFSLLNNQTFTFEIPAGPLSISDFPSSLAEFEGMDYQVHCGIKYHGIKNITPSEFDQLASLSDTVIIDVREPDEYPKLDVPYLSIPLSQLNNESVHIEEKNIIIVCQSGKRSLAAAQTLHQQLGNQYTISNLEGGINNLKNYNG